MDSKNPLVSVVITTYKRETEIIRAAINSVRSQTYDNVEIIIIDDNGMDTFYQKENKKIFSSDNGILYYANIENSGAQVSRNIGILKSKGEYIAFLDDDDIWLPEKLEKQMNLFVANDIAMVFSNGYIVVDGVKILSNLYQVDPMMTDPTYPMMLFYDYVGTTTQVIIRKDCFAKVGIFDVEMPARQDYEMWIRISQKFKIKGINEPLFVHNIHNGEQISKNSIKRLLGYLRIYKKYSKDYSKNPYAKVRILLKICMGYYQLNKFILVFKYLFICFFTSPIYTINCIINKRKHNADFYSNNSNNI